MQRTIIFWLSNLLFLTSTVSGQGEPYIIKRELYKPNLSSINISPDGRILMAGFNDGSFRLLDPQSFKNLLIVEDAHNKAVNAIEMPPKMDFILTAGHNTIKIWDLNGKQVTYWKSHATTIWNVDISNDGRYAVSSEFNKTFRLWDVYNSEIIEQMRGHEDVTMSVCISPDNRWIASGSNDLTVKIWDIETRQNLFTLHGPTMDIYDLAFSPDNRLLAVASKDQTVRIYNLEEQKLIHLLKGHRDFVMEIAFSPDGNYLVSGSADHSLILWDVERGEKIYAYLENEEALLDLVFHPDGGSFFSVSFAGDLTRWALDPEIFVVRYFEKPYHEEISGDHLFDPRTKGETKKEYLSRQQRAGKKRTEIVDRYYQQYLSERDQ